MRMIVVSIIMLVAATAAISAHHESAVMPAKISKDEVAGKIFEREEMIETVRKSGHTTLDVTTLLEVAHSRNVTVVGVSTTPWTSNNK